MSNWQAALLFGVVYFAFVAGVIVGQYIGRTGGYTTTAQDD